MLKATAAVKLFVKLLEEGDAFCNDHQQTDPTPSLQYLRWLCLCQRMTRETVLSEGGMLVELCPDQQADRRDRRRQDAPKPHYLDASIIKCSSCSSVSPSTRPVPRPLFCRDIFSGSFYQSGEFGIRERDKTHFISSRGTRLSLFLIFFFLFFLPLPQ